MKQSKLFQTVLENPRVADFHLKKRKHAALHITLTSLLIAGVITTSMLFYVWARVKVAELNYEIVAAVEQERTFLEKNRELKLKFAALTSPTRLDGIATNQFRMQWPKKDQVVYMK